MSQRFLTTVTGRSPGDHVCWPFHGPDEYVATAREYVAEGLDRGELVAYFRIGPDSLKHTLVSDVARMAGLADVRQLELDPLAIPPGSTPAASAPAHLDRMTRTAVAKGYAGLRLLTDVNDLVRRRDGRRQWIRSEHLIDRYTAGHPLTALCGYDVDDLGEERVAEAARVHALTRGALSPFLLRAADAEGGLALSGEVDVTTADDLYQAMMVIGPDIPARVTVDVSELEFVDHGALVALDRAARSFGVSVTLVHESPLTAWLVGVLRLTNVKAGPGS
jgi:ABC-type transporter Mla MlaB component